MRYIVFDLETQNSFQEVNGSDSTLLDISVGTVYDSKTDKYTTATIDNLEILWPIIEAGDALVGYNSNHFDIPFSLSFRPLFRLDRFFISKLIFKVSSTHC